MKPTTAIVPINCPRCEGAVGVEYRKTHHAQSEQTVRFACPYCGERREFTAPGPVVRIAALRPNAGPAIVH